MAQQVREALRQLWVRCVLPFPMGMPAPSLLHLLPYMLNHEPRRQIDVLNSTYIRLLHASPRTPLPTLMRAPHHPVAQDMFLNDIKR